MEDKPCSQSKVYGEQTKDIEQNSIEHDVNQQNKIFTPYMDLMKCEKRRCTEFFSIFLYFDRTYFICLFVLPSFCFCHFLFDKILRMNNGSSDALARGILKCDFILLKLLIILKF